MELRNGGQSAQASEMGVTWAAFLQMVLREIKPVHLDLGNAKFLSFQKGWILNFALQPTSSVRKSMMHWVPWQSCFLFPGFSGRIFKTRKVIFSIKLFPSTQRKTHCQMVPQTFEYSLLNQVPCGFLPGTTFKGCINFLFLKFINVTYEIILNIHQ